ncbi:MAG: PaaI family thioesterase [Bacteroidia bacterium]|nr:PaaI family thioesterase [Bacteroidia bacterium]
MIVKNHIQKDEFAKLIGIEILEAYNGYAKMRMPITKNHLNGLGSVQGGALFTLADYTMGAASNSMGGECVTLNAQIDYFRGKSEGVLVSVAKPVKQGKTIILYDVEVRMEDTDQLIAVFRGTAFRKR